MNRSLSLPRTSPLPQRLLVRALPLLAALACADTRATLGCGPGAEQLPVVASSGEGRWSRDGRRPRLVELWRAGGLAEGEELADPLALTAAPDGRLAITDPGLGEVIVVEPDGTWRGPWGRRGSGPGEVTLPVAASWNRNGVLAIFDLSAAKVLFLEDAAPAREDQPVSAELTATIFLAGELPWAAVEPHGGILLQPPSQRATPANDASPQSNYLLRYPPGSNSPDTLAHLLTPVGAHQSGFIAAGWPRLLAAVGSDGSIATGGEDARYRLTIRDSTGRAIRVICRDTPPLPVTEGERSVAEDEDLRELIDALEGSPAPETQAAFGRLFWGSRGRLWVQRTRPPPLGSHYAGVPGAVYDVFDPAGQFLGTVTAPSGARLHAAAGDTVYALETGALDETSVVAYRLSFD